MQKLYDQFIREKRFLTNVSERTINYYRWIFNRWTDYVGVMPDKINIKEFVIKIRESGVTVFTANSYIRGINAFLSWLYEYEQTAEHLKIKKLKELEKILTSFSEDQIKRFFAYKPKTFAQIRLYTLICFAFDTGCRIDKILTLRREDVDFENMLVKVSGKGSKQRIVLISIECRKEIFKLFKKHDYYFVFPKTNGEKQNCRTALQVFKELCVKLHIEGVRCSWHTIRHTMASSYVHIPFQCRMILI